MRCGLLILIIFILLNYGHYISVFYIVLGIVYPGLPGLKRVFILVVHGITLGMVCSPWDMHSSPWGRLCVVHPRLGLINPWLSVILYIKRGLPRAHLHVVGIYGICLT